MSKQMLSEARQCLENFFDAGTFTELDRLMQDNGAPASVVCGYGLVNDQPAYAFAQDKAVCHGAVGVVHAAKVRKVYQLAAQNGLPIVSVLNSDGAKLEEGVGAMDAIASMLMGANELSGVVPQIAVVTGSCVGSAALIASAADVVVSVRDADYYLNVGDENAKADILADTVEQALERARELLSYFPSNNLEPAPVCDALQNAAPLTGTAYEIAAALADTDTVYPFYEEETPVAALARINGAVCGVVTLADDSVSCCTAARVARFVRLCDSFSIPVITVVDAAGFECLNGAAKLCQAYAEATTAKITLLAGKTYGAVYIAVASKGAGADVVLALPDASVSALAPETAVHILWTDRLSQMKNPDTDRQALYEEYRKTQCGAALAAEQGALTDVIEPNEAKTAIAAFLEMLSGKRVSKLPKKHANIRL